MLTKRNEALNGALYKLASLDRDNNGGIPEMKDEEDELICVMCNQSYLESEFSTMIEGDVCKYCEPEYYVAQLKPIKLHSSKAVDYLKDWLGLHSLAIIEANNQFLMIRASEHGESKPRYTYRIHIQSDQFGSYAIERRIAQGEEEWEWCDCIPREEAIASIAN